MLLTTIKQAKKVRKETSEYIILNAMVQVKWNNVFFCLKWHWFMAQIFQTIIVSHLKYDYLKTDAGSTLETLGCFTAMLD